MSKVNAKPPKGTRDIGPMAMAVRESAFTVIKEVFQRHGAVAIDTPVFELREVLSNKYGEDSKLIYDLSDDMTSETGEKLSLRYDLSVPFARYIATNNVRNIKRYHIAKVYRRDRPAMERGRFREFYQCDFDIAGVYPAMVPDAEVLTVLCEMFDSLSSISKYHAKYMSSYQIKLSNRKLLDGMFRVCGVKEELLRPICSAVDKLDKESWDTVKKEMIEKGLSDECCDSIHKYVVLNGKPREILDKLRADQPLADQCGDALDEMEKLFDYLDCMGNALDKISFDLSLARGLDYYTGVIFEAVLHSSKFKVGSIGAGGRYDGLVGMFKKNSIPCVGCSLGIERIMSIMVKATEDKAKAEGTAIRENSTQVLVATIAKKTMPDRLKLCKELWLAGIRTEFCYNENWNVGKQVMSALEKGIPLVAVIGEDEIRDGVVNLKDLGREKEERIARVDLPNAILAWKPLPPKSDIPANGAQQ